MSNYDCVNIAVAKYLLKTRKKKKNKQFNKINRLVISIFRYFFFPVFPRSIWHLSAYFFKTMQ